MSTDTSQTLAAKCCKKLKVAPTMSEVSQARLQVQTTAIAATEGKKDLSFLQIQKRNKQIQEMAVIDLKIAAVDQPHAPLQTEARESQLPAPSASLDPQTPGFTPINGLRSSVTQASQQLPQRPSPTTLHSTSRQGGFPSATTRLPVQQPIMNPASGTGLLSRRAMSRRSEKIVPPSAASGGVPKPSSLYMSRCSVASQMATEPQLILLVMDLNGTILHRPNRNRPYHFIERPSTQQFLNYALANFSVMVWSSAKPENVAHMCNQLFPGDSRKNLLAEWGRDRLGLSPQDYGKRVQCYKRLDRIWNDAKIQAQHPHARSGKTWHQGNTVLLDDSVEKSRSEPYNLVEVIEFTGASEDPDILRDLAEYLAILRMQTNVSSYIRQYPLRIQGEAV